VGTSTSGTAAGQVTLGFIADELTGALTISDTDSVRLSVQPTVTLRVTNQNGDPVEGRSATFEIVSGTAVAGLVGGPVELTDANGEAVVSVQGLAPSNVEVRATIAADGRGSAVTQNGTIDFVVGPPAALVFTQQPKLSRTSVDFITPIQVDVVDSDGFRVPGAEVDVTISIETPGIAPAALTGTTLMTSDDGRATFDQLRFTAVKAEYQLRASATGLDAGLSAPMTSMYDTSFDFAEDTRCMVAANQSVYCWGRNNEGQTGSAPVTVQSSPVQIPGTETYRSVVTGGRHSCALTSADFAARCWGLAGVLGTSPPPVAGTAVAVDGNHSYGVLAIGIFTTCGLTRGNVSQTFCWGVNDRAQMGNGSTGAVGNTIGSGPIAQNGLPFRDADLDLLNGCAVNSGDQLFCWGSAVNGVTGVGVIDASVIHTSPQRVAPGVRWREVRVSQRHACALTNAGQAACWGRDLAGNLGFGVAAGEAQGEPTDVAPEVRFLMIRTGESNSCGLTDQAEFYCWGSAAALNASNNTETQIDFVWDARVSNFALGRGGGCLVDATGAAHCWGSNSLGQLGLGHSDRVSGVQPVSGGLTFLTEPPPSR